MEVSVIIPTRDRPKDMMNLLKSILEQTHLPKEVIVVDDSSNFKTANVVEEVKTTYMFKGISLYHIKNITSPNSIRIGGITDARNRGLNQANKDIILFLDDDVIPNNDYIEELLKIYDDEEGALGVQGYITNQVQLPSFRERIGRLFNKAFFLTHYEENINRLLPSFQNVHAMPLNRVINCQWMIGANSSYKREIFDFFRFDESLRMFCSGEDADFSYRIYKRYPHSLYQTPRAKLVHKRSVKPGLSNRTLVYMGQAYHTYLFYKDLDQRLLNQFIFLWSRFGLVLETLTRALGGSEIMELLYLLGSYRFCMRHLNSLRRLDLEFFNRSKHMHAR